MWWHCKNFVSSSDTKGCPLSRESSNSGPYCEMSSSKCAHRDWGDLVETLYSKGYFLNRAQVNKILLILVGEVIWCDLLSEAIRYISRKHGLHRGRGFVFSANGAPADIVGYVSIYARPIHCLPHLCLHPIDTLMGPMQISKGTIEELWRNTYSCTLEE